MGLLTAPIPALHHGGTTFSGFYLHVELTGAETTSRRTFFRRISLRRDAAGGAPAVVGEPAGDDTRRMDRTHGSGCSTASAGHLTGARIGGVRARPGVRRRILFELHARQLRGAGDTWRWSRPPRSDRQSGWAAMGMIKAFGGAE